MDEKVIIVTFRIIKEGKSDLNVTINEKSLKCENDDSIRGTNCSWTCTAACDWMLMIIVKLQQPENKLCLPYIRLRQEGGEEEGRRGEGGFEQHHAGDVDPLADPKRRVVAFSFPWRAAELEPCRLTALIRRRPDTQ